MNPEKSKFRIVIDGAGDVPPDWVTAYQIETIPINIHFGERAYLQGIDLSDQDFYRMALDSQEFPKTSQPTPQQFIQFYRKIAGIGDTILSIHITQKLSGTFTSAQIAANEMKGEYNIYPIDSGSGSAAIAYMAREARLMERSGASVQAILKNLEGIARRVQIILSLQTMDFARRSGRVKSLQATLASLLNVKPIIFLKNGELLVGNRVRTWHKALEFIVEEMANRVSDRLVNVAVVHAEDQQSADTLIRLVKSRLNLHELIVTTLSIGIAANLGPGTAGVVAYPVEDMNEG